MKSEELSSLPELPGKGVEVSYDDLIRLANEYEWDDVFQALTSTPRPEKPFKSDGCSCWPDSWFNVSIYECCFRHDIHYWCGMPGDDIARLKADCQLAIDVAETTGSIKLAETMFAGVRAGGVEDLELSFSWGFGRVN